MSPDTLLVPQPTQSDFPEFVSIPMRVARNAKAFPDKRAVVCEGKTRTWARVRQAHQQDRPHAGRHGRGQGRQGRHPRRQLDRVCRNVHRRAARRRLRRAALDHGGGRCAGEDARRLRRQGAFPVGSVSQPGRAVRGAAAQADRRRPHRVRLQARGLARLRSVAGAGERCAVRGADRTSSTTSTSSTARARPACPRASCTATRCATCWRCGSRRFAYGPDTISIASTPLYSNTTMVALLPTLGVGGTTVADAQVRRASKFLEIAPAPSRDPRDAGAGAVPAPAGASRLRPLRSRARFKVKLFTSAPLRAETKRDIVARWPGRLIEIYGLTEGGGSCMLDAQPVSRQAAHRRQAVADERDRGARRAGQGAAAGRDRRSSSGRGR